MGSTYNILLQKIDGFTRKYYMNLLLRGVLVWTAIVVPVFLALALSEFRLFFRPGLKIPLVVLFLLLAVGSAVYLIGLPLLSLLKLGKQISQEQAAAIIGRHFPEVSDKLLNLLQLHNRPPGEASRDLLLAGIDQKASEISLVPFAGAVDFSVNKRYLRYAVPPILILIALVLASPNVIRDSTRRLAQPAQTFEKTAPFRFDVRHPDRVVQYDNAVIEVRLEGKALPAEVYLNRDGKPYKMNVERRDLFSFEVRNVEAAFGFTLEANGFRSQPYTVDVIPKPALVDARVELQYPAYTGMRPESVRSVGELVVPAGTRATWKFNARHTEAIRAVSAGEESDLKADKNYFEHERRLLSDDRIAFYLSNRDLDRADSVVYSARVLPDKYPSLTAELITDTTAQDFLYFVGEYADDYGISDLRFRFTVDRNDADATDSTGSERLPFERNTALGRYAHFTNTALYNLRPGDRVDFFFEVSDNDGVSGPKSTKSKVFSYRKPTVQEFKEMEEEKNRSIKEDLAEALDKVDRFRKDVDQLKKESLDKKSLSWEDKKKLEDLMQQHKELSESLQKMQDGYKQNRQNQEEFRKTDPDILEKQQKIEELMEEVLTEEMREMMQQIQEMMEQLQLENMMQDMEEFDMTNEALEQQLDRMLELFKKLEFEQKMQDIINELEELSKEQLALSEESRQEQENPEELLEKQQAINEEFEELKKDLDKLEELNKEQRSPANLDQAGEKSEEISEEMKQGTEQLQQNQPKKASPSQQKAGEKMQEMANQMSGMMNQMMAMQATEDLDNLRRLLENLVQFSHEQEALFGEVAETETEQPKFRDLVQQQYKLKDDAAMIEDSLVALSKRVFQLESFITDELRDLNRELTSGLDNLVERRKGQAVVNQQYVMTSANNLALMLSETMEQMQEAMARSMPGNQQCQKPGGKGSLPSMQQLQEQLNQEMQDLGDAIKKGRQPGGSELSKEFARMAAEQAALREALRKLKESMSQGQKEGGQIDQLLQQMDETETDLLNKRITEETLKRQEQIIKNLLDMETAEREQDKEEKRESETADPKTRALPPAIEEYLRERQSTVETYRSVPPSLSPFYKKLVEKYFRTVN